MLSLYVKLKTPNQYAKKPDESPIRKIEVISGCFHLV